MPFREAREFAHKLNLKSSSEWIKYYKGEISGVTPLPKSMPTNPQATYKTEGWKNWNDWLGLNRVPRLIEPKLDYQNKWMPFREARDFARSLKIESFKDWILYCKGGKGTLPEKPKAIPMNPQSAYLTNGWINWGDWLGTADIRIIKEEHVQKKNWRQFEEARIFARSLGLFSQTEWIKYWLSEDYEGLPDLPPDIPKVPETTYDNLGWIDYDDWLGIKKQFHIEKSTEIDETIKEWLSYEEAIKFVHKLSLTSGKEWKSYCMKGKEGYPNLPKDIPKNPVTIYRDKGWTGIKDWLGYEKTFKQFPESCEFARSLKLGGWGEWINYVKNGKTGLPNLPKDIPKNPQFVYKDKGWKGTSHWLGLEKQGGNDEWIETIDYLNNYHTKYGHFNLPETEKFKALNNWVNTVRTQKNSGTLNTELEKKLLEIGFDWAPFSKD